MRGRLPRSTAAVVTAQYDAYARTLRIVTGDWCQLCHHSRDEHSRILAGAPCLDCDCFGWTPPTTATPPIFTTPEPPPRHRWWRRTPSPGWRIHNRTTPRTAELWRDGQAVS